MAGGAMNYSDARDLVRSLGMSVSDDGVAFTVCGGQLVNGHEAPAEIQAMNGWTVDDVAGEVMAERRTDEDWPFSAMAPGRSP
jgi:hypothetical protein